MKMRNRRRGTLKGLPMKEVLFEYQRVGNIMRVTAIDPVTAIEVIMIADPKQGMETIKRLAARKLAYVLAKKRAKAEKDGDKSGRFNKLV